MEQEELAMEAARLKEAEEKQWMEKVLAENKQEFGANFGEDLSLDFGK